MAQVSPLRPGFLASHRVPVHVSELLHAPSFGEYVEIIIACLPEWTLLAATRNRGKRMAKSSLVVESPVALNERNTVKRDHFVENLRTLC